MYLPRSKQLKGFSRSLRKDATKEEKHLWYDCLKNYPLQFNRQRIIGHFIVDFYCAAVKLAVELDGSQHYDSDYQEYDQDRTLYLENLGIAVLRFTNLDIHDRFEGVCMMIDQKVHELSGGYLS